MTIPEGVRNNIISLLVGAFITALATRLHAKTKRLRYSTRVDRLALSADDPIFGSVRILWGDQPVRNLYMAEVQVENCSNQDFEDVVFKVYTANETFLLNERTYIIGSPDIVYWSPEFKARLAVGQGLQPTPEQSFSYYHSREYRVPVFNRRQLLQFNYLCTRPNDDQQPGVFVSTHLKGAKLRHQVRANLVLGIPIQLVIVRGLVIAALTFAVCGLWLRNVWLASGISMVAGLFAQHIGAAEYKVERWVWTLISG